MSRLARRGFTLIELLVVVGIIALLIAILVPTLRGAREQARKSACLANLSALGKAMYFYAEAHNDMLPNCNPLGSWTNAAAQSAALVALYNGYIKQPKSFFCPSDTDPMPTDIVTADYELPNSAHVSYEFYSIWWAPEFGPKLRVLQTLAPLAWDIDGGDAQSKLRTHSAGGNVLYGDASASWQPMKEWDDTNWAHPANQYYPAP